MLQLVPSQKSEPNPEVIAKLEAVLEAARKGEVEAVLMFVSYDDTIQSTPVGPFELSQLSFAMDRMKAVLIEASYGDEEE